MAEAVTELKEREFSFNDREFHYLAELVAKCTGIVLAYQKKDMVYSRLARRLRALELTSFGAYCQRLEGEEGEDEIGHLVNAITTNLTHFFRETHHFEHLREIVLAPLNAKPPKPRRLRIWSAGCSSGMEPYSIAMTVKASLRDLASWDARILATDIDTNMLNCGIAGDYGSEQWEKIPPSYRGDVLRLPKQEYISMSDELKKLIAFKHLNLLESWPMQGLFDVIFCRNVVIYFDKPTQRKLFSRMADLLKPNGWLYIGHSENLFKVCDRFELAGRTIYRRID
jgi:chemotaxis protein methyltransferase CheR